MAITETYNKYYKLLLILPIVLLIFSLGYMYNFYQQNNDFIKKDVSLTGGTTITIYPQNPIDLDNLKSELSKTITDFSVREISSITSGKQEAVVIESPASVDELKPALEKYLGYSLDTKNSSIEFTGAFLSENFYNQLLRAIALAFILMSLVVFVLFRTFVPSFAVILSAFADILMTLVVVNMLGVNVSSAGIVAFLMLIGYSVDTDIMLTTKCLKQKENSLNHRIFASFKTGMTMTLTSIVAISVGLILTASFSEVLKQIFLILLIGLFFDIFNTWVTNTSILKWYIEHKEKKSGEHKQ